MFRWIIRLFVSQSQPSAETGAHIPSSPEVLRRLRAEALAKVQDAERRRDDRDLGRARMALQEATHAELRAAR